MQIYKVLTLEEWDSFSQVGEFTGSPIDIKDGYIHMSKKEQLDRILKKYFSGKEVMIAEVDYEAIESEIKWEAASNGDLFPHLYRPLKLEDLVLRQET